jgi:YgiT-type zinc finger domain-containing protein
MECSCGGALIEGKSSYRTNRDNFTFILENIPAYKCTRCDKVLFGETTVEKIKKLENRIDRECKEILTGKISTNLYDY